VNLPDFGQKKRQNLPDSTSNSITCLLLTKVLTDKLSVHNATHYYFFTLSIKESEGFGKNWKKIVRVTITPGSPQTQRNCVVAASIIKVNNYY